ncbi:DinB family protein [Methylopila musalis]|uniref:DinB family protein n=1 Tax=Methylopila musalis TaxID=1134781 RepID=A0ABW3Z4Q8_9HYPH
MLSHWTTFAAYNAWANRRLYDAVAALPADDFARDGGAFFRSLKGTLNHLAVTDEIWLDRLRGGFEPPRRLDDVPYPEFAALRSVRTTLDAALEAHVAELTPDDLDRELRFRRQASPEPIRQRVGPALAHLFNHQTHHRGQAHALLTQFGGPEAGPPLDLLLYLRETGAA